MSLPAPTAILMGFILIVLPFTKAAKDCGSDFWSTLLTQKNNGTALRSIDAPPWVSALEFRSTVSILKSCLLTLFPCIYTALHMNVPMTTDFRSQLALKSKWMALSLFAPELVLYTAACQLHAAWDQRKQLRAL
ncbi:hypothetical protein ACHAQA_007115 [Verticillium albo-atrum]